MVKEERIQIGIQSSLIGFVCNIILALTKVIIGVLTNSISIMSDGFNNFSDGLSCVVSIFGYQLSKKPADKDHPFGHGRYEYIASFIVAIFILLFDIELFRNSLHKLFVHEQMTIAWWMLIVLAFSIGVKLILSIYFGRLGRKYDSLVLKATSLDYRNDSFSTLISIIAVIFASYFPNIPFDAIGGIILSLFILKSAIAIFKEIFDCLLGKPASKELTDEILRIIHQHSEILGVHDMIIHDYGPGMKIGSAHCEIDSRMSMFKAHQIIDQIEQEIADQIQVMVTIHTDPIQIDDPLRNAYYEKVKQALAKIDPQLHFHDFRIVDAQSHINCIFDLVIPFGYLKSHDEIKRALMAYFDDQTQFSITFDHAFIEGE